MTGPLWLPDDAALADVGTFLGRAKRLDADGAARLTAHGSLLVLTVGVLHGGGGPTVLGMRVLVLAEPSDVDATVPLAALTDRLARRDPVGAGTERADDGSGTGTGPARRGVPLPVPPMSAAGAAWAGVLPPRRGWEPVGTLPVAALAEAARAGIAEVAAGAPEGAGAAAVARLRALVWGRELAAAPGAGIPAGAAFAADALGFLGPVPGWDGATVHRAGPWVRLSTGRGHVVARPAALLG